MKRFENYFCCGDVVLYYLLVVYECLVLECIPRRHIVASYEFPAVGRLVYTECMQVRSAPYLILELAKYTFLLENFASQVYQCRYRMRWRAEIRIWNTSTSEVLVPVDQDPLLTSNNIDTSKWTLYEDGRNRGMHNELLLWVPYDIRPTLCFPPSIAIINNKEGFSTALDFSGSAQSKRWHECFHPLK